MTQRTAFKMFLKPGFKEEYRKRHNEIWPELEALIKSTGDKYFVCCSKAIWNAVVSRYWHKSYCSKMVGIYG